MFALGIVLAWFHLGNAELSVAGYILAFLLCFTARSYWLVMVPTAIVAGHSYPITGSLLVAPGDLFVIAAVASVLLRCQEMKIDRPMSAVTLLLLVIAGVGAVRGWLLLPRADLNQQLDLYLTGLNSLYLFKGYALGALLGLGLMAQWAMSPTIAWRRLSQGMQLSAVVVALFVLSERSFAFGVLDFGEVFRASGPIFTMHIGGQHIDCFWCLALPFLLFSGFRIPNKSRLQTTASLSLVVVTGVLSAYAIYATMSRSTIALAAALITGAILIRVCSHAQNKRVQLISVIGGLLMLTLMSVMWFAGDAVKARFASTRGDLNTRIAHVTDVGVLAASTNPVVGRGLGVYPLTYRQYQGLSDSILRMRSDSPNHETSGVLIQPGCDVYLEQLVASNAPGPWQARVDYTMPSANVSPNAPLSVFVCEKTLLQSFHCVNPSSVNNLRAAREDSESGAGSTGGTLEFLLDVGEFQSEKDSDPSLPTWRPMSIAVVASGGVPVLLNQIEIVDSKGNPVVRNGDFRAGSQHWFFTADDHLVWRAKNAWVQLRLELGWLGVFAWVGFIGFVGWRLIRLSIYARQENRGITHSTNTERITCGAAILAGWIPMSVFGTLIDTPWIIQLLFLLLTSVGIMVGHTKLDRTNA